jgi:hypothetical protein
MMQRKVKPPPVGLPALMFTLGMAMLLTGIVLVALSISGTFEGGRGPRGYNGSTGATGPSGNGSIVPEAFSVAYIGGQTINDINTTIQLTNWTDTVDTLTFPDLPTSYLFRDLTLGTLNLTTGEFTVGADGVYVVTHPQYAPGGGDAYLHVSVNGVGAAVSYMYDAAIFSTLLRLVQGDTVRIMVIAGNSPNTLAVEWTTQEPTFLPTYGIVWTMYKVA